MAANISRAHAQLNKGVRSFGVDVVVAHVKSFSSSNGCTLPVVSVGSGMGAVESLTDGVPWILVDPAPMSFANHPDDYDGEGAVEPLRMPDYPLVKDLVLAKPEIVGNCLLFLNWCEPNDSDYDYEAVEQLKPRGVLSLIELYHGLPGAAGGDKFHDWLVGIRRKRSDTSEYRILGESTLSHHPQTTTPMDIRIVWVQRAGDEVNPPAGMKYVYSSLIPHTKTDCIVC
jgi:hypothetical protein